MNTLEGRRAIVTGSSRGIGRSIALFLAGHGARVVVTSRGADDAGRRDLDAVVDEIVGRGGQAIAVPGQLGDPAFAQHLVDRCSEEYGGVDIVVNNAGTYSYETVSECSLDTWKQTMQTNLDAVFYLCRAALPVMVGQRWGRIVSAGSSAGIGAMGGSAYPASKSAVFGLTRAIASSYGPYGITANCYNPEALTEMSMTAGREAFESTLDHYVAKGFSTPAERANLSGIGGPDGVAPWVGYLCTDEADYLNGHVFAVEARRVALLAWPDEQRTLTRNAGRHGNWSLAELASTASLAFPVSNRWPRRDGAELCAWEKA